MSTTSDARNLQPYSIATETTEFTPFWLVRHMKINNKSKFAMNIFHQTRRRITLIIGLLEQFADEQRTKSENRNFIFRSSNFPCGHLLFDGDRLLCEYSVIVCESSFIYDGK